MDRLRTSDFILIAVIAAVIAVGLVWPSSAPWVFFLVALPASIIWAQKRGFAGRLRPKR